MRCFSNIAAIDLRLYKVRKVANCKIIANASTFYHRLNRAPQNTPHFERQGIPKQQKMQESKDHSLNLKFISNMASYLYIQYCYCCYLMNV